MNELELFAAAIAIADPGQRAALLDQHCADQPQLRQRLEQLLEAHFRFNPLLDHAGPVHTNSYGDPDAEPGSQCTTAVSAGTVIAGKYTLIDLVAEGGMGSVWRAKQSEPVKRFVAVKLIKAGMDSRQVLARFEAERQALALMDHPNIAKVLDGGLHEQRPFFVMELVKGVPITDYCDTRKLTPKERLELFVPVCQVIQHAHQKGIIHRDIKPSNVLIALYDDRPVVKVIDFGVAKATGGTLTEATIDTGFGVVVGTPQYMSPEQATFNNLDIDTRSDVYALGVLLYELLTGSPPFSRQQLEKKGLLEIHRVVREEEPPRPSTRLSTADALPTLSANRGTDPKKLTGLLRHELDWVVMKALEKDRTRRYESANSLAADVLRYLSGEAVQAHPPSTTDAAAYSMAPGEDGGAQRSRVARKSSTTVLNTAGASSMVMCAVPGMIRMWLPAIPAAICRCQLSGVTGSWSPTVRSVGQAMLACSPRTAPSRSARQCWAYVLASLERYISRSRPTRAGFASRVVAERTDVSHGPTAPSIPCASMTWARSVKSCRASGGNSASPPARIRARVRFAYLPANRWATMLPRECPTTTAEGTAR
jgi:serine/threonine protein kinase